MITEILDYLDEEPTIYTSSTRIKRKIENIGRKESTDANDYGRKLSFLRELDLVEKREHKNSWRITSRGQKWVREELDLRDV